MIVDTHRSVLLETHLAMGGDRRQLQLPRRKEREPTWADAADLPRGHRERRGADVLDPVSHVDAALSKHRELFVDVEAALTELHPTATQVDRRGSDRAHLVGLLVDCPDWWPAPIRLRARPVGGAEVRRVDVRAHQK